jgi:hypothetical protein
MTAPLPKLVYRGAIANDSRQRTRRAAPGTAASRRRNRPARRDFSPGPKPANACSKRHDIKNAGLKAIFLQAKGKINTKYEIENDC